MPPEGVSAIGLFRDQEVGGQSWSSLYRPSRFTHAYLGNAPIRYEDSTITGRRQQKETACTHTLSDFRDAGRNIRGSDMNRIEYILVLVDPTVDHHPCVTKAALLAERLKARLELFVCDTKAAREKRLLAYTMNHRNAPFVYDPRAQLEALAAPLRARGLDVVAETEHASRLHSGLVDRVNRTTADLIVKDTHHHSLSRRTVFTNTDWELIRCCRVPLLLTKEKEWPITPRIAAAIDPGHVNDKPALLDHYILENASFLVSQLAGEMHVIHAFVPTSVAAAAAATAPLMPVQLDFSREREATVRNVRSLLAECGVETANLHLELGGPAELLPDVAARLGIDVMVMGAISRSGVKRVLMGSTAEDVLERLPCDELIVKSPDFAECLPCAI